MTRVLWSCLLLGAGCACDDWRWDYDGGPGTPQPTLVPSPPPCGDDAPQGAAGSPDADEVCDGVDNDCDGLVDDGDPDRLAPRRYVDADGDGWGDPGAPRFACDPTGLVEDDTDCDDADPTAHPGATESWAPGDQDCDGLPDPDPCVVAPTGAPATADPACAVLPPLGWFNPVIEWQAEARIDGGGASYSTPVVGRIVDRDDDGDVDEDDGPSIAVVQWESAHAAIAIWPGDGQGAPTLLPALPTDLGPLWPSMQSDLALADLDADGRPELIGTWQDPDDGQVCYLGAQSTGGGWARVDLPVGCGHHAPAVADLTGDGSVEVEFGGAVFAADGATGWIGGGGQGWDPGYVNSGYHAFAADLDGDGPQEVLAGVTIYEADGAPRCTIEGDDGYPAVADLDGDGAPEIVISGAYGVRIATPQCVTLRSWLLPDGGHGGPPTLADFDGDGRPEIGIAGKDLYVVWEADGTPRWSRAIQDASSHSTGSAAFDFDGDGASEAVYADELDLWIFDGSTGTPLLQEGLRESGTRNEYPVVADVDGDGSAEIVVTNDGDAPTLFVVGDAWSRWPGARPLWTQHAFRHDAVGPDGQPLPAPPQAGAGANSFRQGEHTSPPIDPTPSSLPAADLAAIGWGACRDGGTWEFWAQAVNEGALPAEARLLVTQSLGGDLEATVLDMRYTLAPGEAGPVEHQFVWAGTAAAELRVRVDPDDVIRECQEGDNLALIALPPG